MKVHRVWVFVSLLALLVSVLPALSKARERVAVLEFRNMAGIPETDLDYLVDVVVRGAVREALPAREYMIMTRESMVTLLEDSGISLGQVCEGACEVDVGRKIGAHRIVTGSVWKVGALLEVTVKLFDTRSGDLISQKTVSGKDLALLKDPLGKAVTDLAFSLRFPGGGGSGPVFAVPSGAGSPDAPATGVTDVVPTTLPGASAGPAGLYITTDPPGADVYLGSVRAGTASPAFQKMDLQAGTRLRVTLRKRDYREMAFDVDLKPGITKYEGVKLLPAYGTLVIESAPSGATVTIGGQRVGRTPYRNERMASGQHLVSVDLDLHRSVTNQVVEVNDGQTTRELYKLEADFGTLFVDSEPRGASVTVGGTERGKTPLEVKLSSGRYDVSLDLAGYKTQGFQVIVDRGKRAEISAAQARLWKRVFTVNVFADPPEAGARILLDGRDTGRQAPDTLVGIPEGTHTIEVKTATRAGKVDLSGLDGESTSVKVPLKAASNDAAGDRAGGNKAVVHKPTAVVEEVEAAPGNVWQDPVTGMEFVWVPGGCYTMGCGHWTNDCYDDEKPSHAVCLDGFWMGKTEVTQRQWKKVMGNNPSHSKGSVLRLVKKDIEYPVDQVSWQDAQAFVAKLSSSHHGRYAFRLPTEAEWEYACRSGGKPEKYAGGRSVGEAAWYYTNSGGASQQAGTKPPNGLGLYDMSGSVWEWCEDVYDKSAYGAHRKNNPVSTRGGSHRVLRGGSWYDNARSTRCGNRLNHAPDKRLSIVGLRLVREE